MLALLVETIDGVHLTIFRGNVGGCRSNARELGLGNLISNIVTVQPPCGPQRIHRGF